MMMNGGGGIIGGGGMPPFSCHHSNLQQQQVIAAAHPQQQQQQTQFDMASSSRRMSLTPAVELATTSTVGQLIMNNHPPSNEYPRRTTTIHGSGGCPRKRGNSEHFGEVVGNGIPPTGSIFHKRDKSSSIAMDKYVFSPPLGSVPPRSPPLFHFPSMMSQEKRRLNPSFTLPSIVNLAKRRSSRPISYGYASLYPFREEFELNDEDWYEEEGEEAEEEDDGRNPPCTTSSVAADEIEPAECKGKNTPTPSNDETDTQHMTLFFLRFADQRIMPVYCFQPMGVQADEFIQALSGRQKDALKKFITHEKPEEDECYVWVREDPTLKTTVLSLKTLENHFKNEHINRVKWRHLSIDKVSVYRYSLPVITTKFRLRLAHFLSRNYRCCILCVWCMVILMISVGIVMSVAFGSSSSPSSSSSTNTINNINDDLLNTTRIGGNNSASSASPLFQVVPIGSLGSVTGAADGLQGGPVLYHTDTEQWNNWKHERRKKFKRVKQALLEHNH